SFTELPREWSTLDANAEEKRLAKYCHLCVALMMRRMRPADDFAYNYNLKYACLISPNIEWRHWTQPIRCDPERTSSCGPLRSYQLQ
ncbi:hypothetical protein PFISCL1PPCAC_23353, partial [Pristionchus fissidentatus]